MSLFTKKNFIGHAGGELDWKIECDDLTDEDWQTLAYIVSKSYTFGAVIGIPRGGLKFAEALKPYITLESEYVLIVDDVLTTGMSMEEAKTKYMQTYKCHEMDIFGIVAFSRKRVGCPEWIQPILQLGIPE